MLKINSPAGAPWRRYPPPPALNLRIVPLGSIDASSRSSLAASERTFAKIGCLPFLSLLVTMNSMEEGGEKPRRIRLAPARSVQVQD